MSLFKALALSSLIFLAACGLEPMYSKGNTGGQQITAALPNIDIAGIPDRDGQYLRNLLIDQLYAHGRPGDAPYLLTFAPLEKDTVNLGIRKSATATRAQVEISTHMKLVEKATSKVLLSRDLKSIGAYNLLDNQLASIVSQQNITESLLQEMRDSAVRELSLYFRRSGTAVQ